MKQVLIFKFKNNMVEKKKIKNYINYINKKSENYTIVCAIN